MFSCLSNYTFISWTHLLLSMKYTGETLMGILNVLPRGKAQMFLLPKFLVPKYLQVHWIHTRIDVSQLRWNNQTVSGYDRALKKHDINKWISWCYIEPLRSSVCQLIKEIWGFERVNKFNVSTKRSVMKNCFIFKNSLHV